MPLKIRYDHFYADLFAEINNLIESHINDTVIAVSQAIAPSITSLLIIYIAIWAWSMARGMIQEPITDGATRIIALAIIANLALNVGLYNTYISSWIWKTPEAMANIISTEQPGNGGMDFLDELFFRSSIYGDLLWTAAEMNKYGPFPNPLYAILSILMKFFGLLLTGYAAALIILAKFMLAVLLGIGPIFVTLLIFQSTRKFFESWLSQCLNYVFMVILIAALFALIGNIISSFVREAAMTAARTQNPNIESVFMAYGFIIIAFILLLQIAPVASALGGGVAISTLGAAGIAWSKISGALRRLTPTAMAERRRQIMRRHQINKDWSQYKKERRAKRIERVKRFFGRGNSVSQS